MKIIDMMGKVCPMPVLEARKVLADQSITAVQISVDNIAAVRNLEKMANGLGYEFSFSEIAKNAYEVVICADKNSVPVTQGTLGGETSSNGLVVLIGSDKMGQGTEELGKILIKGFIYSLSELPTPPQHVIFLNSGVYLTCSGSNATEDLKSLADKGAKVLSCGTCLNFYGLTEGLVVGEIANMYEVTEIISAASKIMNI